MDAQLEVGRLTAYDYWVVPETARWECVGSSWATWAAVTGEWTLWAADLAGSTLV